MDPFAASIAKTIEEEVERRVNDKLTHLLQYMADEYNIPLKTLARMMDKNDVKVTRCIALTKNGKRCKNPNKKNGYCGRHQHMYQEVKYKSPEVKLKHTHALPPLYVCGCPACEKSKPLRDLVDCFENGEVGSTSTVALGIF